MTTPATNGSDAGRSTRAPRGSLSSEGILAAAFELADKESVDALSMPKLARQLGVGVTSLYWYFRSKDELLDAMLARASDQYLSLLPNHGDLPWDEHMRRYFHDMKRIFHENPVICDFLVFYRSKSRGRPRLRLFERISREAAVLIEAGFDAETAARGYMAMSVYTQGCVHKQRQFILSGGSPESDRFMSAEASEILRIEGIDAPQFAPGAEEAIEHWSASFATDTDFSAGLDLIIAGLGAQLSASSAVG